MACGTEESHQTVKNLSICNMEVKYIKQSEKRYMHYIDSGLFAILQYLKKPLQGDSLNNLVASIYGVTQHRHLYHNCLNVNTLLQDSDEAGKRDRLLVSLKSPCSTIYTKPSNPLLAQWLITVYNIYMINVTINTAYIPFSEECRLHDIEVHEGLNVTDNSIIDQYCGVISGEITYTQYNRALVKFQLSTVVQPLEVFMVLQYQIHLQGVAYRFNHFEKLCMPNWLHVDILPSLIEFTSENLRYIWYLSSSVFYSKDYLSKDRMFSKAGVYGKINVTDPVLVQYYLNISNYVCQKNCSHLEIYKGLLPASWYMWQAVPQTTVQCGDNIMFYKLDFHFYFTIILHTEILAFSHIELDMAMKYIDQPIPNIGTKLKLHGHTSVQDGHLDQTKHMSKGMIDFQYMSLRFGRLKPDLPRGITMVNRLIHTAKHNKMAVGSFENFSVVPGECF